MKFRTGILLATAVLLGPGAPSLRAQAPQFLWAKRVASTTNPDNELAMGLALDSQSNAYVTGWFDGTNDFGGVTLTNRTPGGQDIFVAKYDSAGALQWAQRAGSGSPDWNNGRGIGVDAGGNAYVTGGFHANADFGPFNLTATQHEDFFLAMYNSAYGFVEWVQQSSGGGHSAYGTGLAVDAAGNSYAVGYFDGATVTFGGTVLTNNGDYSVFLVKYDYTGTLQWARGITGPGYNYATKVVLDSAGNVYLRGGFTISTTIGSTNLVSAGSTDVYVAKFNSDGVLQWVQRAGGTGDDPAEGGPAVDQLGNVYISGAYGSNPITFGGPSLTNGGGFDGFLAKYNSAGGAQWASRAGGNDMDWLVDVSVDGYGNPYVTGAILSSNAQFGTITMAGPGGYGVIAKYDFYGNPLWVQKAAGMVYVFRSAVDTAGNCYAAGWFQDTAHFGTNTLTGPGVWNFFLTQLASDGTPPLYFTYAANNGALTITGYIGSDSDVTIPGTINGLPVTSIGDNAFLNSSLTGVTIPNTITNIGITAFWGCTSLTNITIPNSVIGIGDFAFRDCTSLTSITIPNSLTSIGGWGVFQGCTSLTSVTIPNSVISIGNGAFGGCASLTNVTIPNSVTYIGDFAFGRCSSLSGITIPNSVTSIGSAFWGCSNLTSITIPHGVTSIGGTFSYCTSLTNVTLPNTLTSMGVHTFQDCTSLTSITIPSSVLYIWDHAFSGCTNLAGIYFQGDAPYLGGPSVFENANLAVAYYLPGTAGWDSTFGDRPTVLWNPQIDTADATFGVQNSQFGFTIIGTPDISMVLEACTNLASLLWTPLQTCTLTNGSLYFSDPRWTNYPARFYRLRSP